MLAQTRNYRQVRNAGSGTVFPREEQPPPTDYPVPSGQPRNCVCVCMYVFNIQIEKTVFLYLGNTEKYINNTQLHVIYLATIKEKGMNFRKSKVSTRRGWRIE